MQVHTTEQSLALFSVIFSVGDRNFFCYEKANDKKNVQCLNRYYAIS